MSKAYPEDGLQIQVAEYLDLIKVLWCHVANERKTSPPAGARLKRKGVKSGVPDVMIFDQSEYYIGLAIELKIKPNKPTATQKDWLSKLEKAGWKTAVCHSLDEVMATWKRYKNNSLE